MTNDGMTRREREDLARLARRREQLAKADARQRAAELVADVERQLAEIYPENDPRWSDVSAAARAAIAEADRAIAARCFELGIPARFRPSLNVNWYGRGENASAARRAELRKVATTRIAALEAQARAAIERGSVEVQTQLLAGGLETDAARAFLAAMPTADALMPPLRLTELEAAVPLDADGRREQTWKGVPLAEIGMWSPERAALDSEDG
jgi:hypothetical protein